MAGQRNLFKLVCFTAHFIFTSSKETMDLTDNTGYNLRFFKNYSGSYIYSPDHINFFWGWGIKTILKEGVYENRFKANSHHFNC